MEKFPQFVEIERQGWIRPGVHLEQNRYRFIVPSDAPTPTRTPLCAIDPAEGAYYRSMLAAIPDLGFGSHVARFQFTVLLYHSQHRQSSLSESECGILIRSSVRYLDIHARQMNSGRNHIEHKRGRPYRTWKDASQHSPILNWRLNWTQGGKPDSRTWLLPPGPEGFTEGEARIQGVAKEDVMTTSRRMLEALAKEKKWTHQLMKELGLNNHQILGAGYRLQKAGLVKKHSDRKVEGVKLPAEWERIRRKPKGKIQTPRWSFTPDEKEILHDIAMEHERDIPGFATDIDKRGFSRIVQPHYKTCAGAVLKRNPNLPNYYQKIGELAHKASVVSKN